MDILGYKEVCGDMNKPNAVVYCRIDRNNSEMTLDIIAARKHSIEIYAKQHGIDIIGYYEDQQL